MRPGGACTACPGFSLSLHRPRRERWTAAHRWTQPPRVQAVSYTHAHSRHRGRTEPRNRARVQGHRQAPKQATEPPTAAHRRKQSTAPVTIPPETPINAQQSRPGRGCYPPILPAAKTPHSGAQSRLQRASRRGYRNAGEGKPTAATAPAQHPGQKSGRFSVIFRAFFCHFSRLCPTPGESFIVESR